MINKVIKKSRALEIGDVLFIAFWISLLLVLFVQTLSFGPMARLVPMLVIVPSLVLVSILLIIKIHSAIRLTAANKRESNLTFAEMRIVERNANYGMRQKTRVKDEIMVVAWFAILIILINCAGFFWGVPLYAFLYLKLGAGERWRTSIFTSISLLLVLYLVFYIALGFHFYPGLIWKWNSI